MLLYQCLPGIFSFYSHIANDLQIPKNVTKAIVNEFYNLV